MNSSKKLIINADDYGACSKVNLGVEQLALTGRLSGVSVLANGDGWPQAVNFLRDHSELSGGVHLNVVEGQPISAVHEVRVLANKEGSFVGLRALLRRWLLNPAGVSRVVEIEWRAQIERLMRARVKITHADSQCHLHAFPLAYQIAEKLYHEYSIVALRWPHERENDAFRRASAIALTASLHPLSHHLSSETRQIGRATPPIKIHSCGLRRQAPALKSLRSRAGFKPCGEIDHSPLLHDASSRALCCYYCFH
jgi:predicted glycoside hydrolase/deacetylase ChbG (UPF0249 family)